jgi:hypothetical protein
MGDHTTGKAATNTVALAIRRKRDEVQVARLARPGNDWHSTPGKIVKQQICPLRRRQLPGLICEDSFQFGL